MILHFRNLGAFELTYEHYPFVESLLITFLFGLLELLSIVLAFDLQLFAQVDGG